MRELYTKYKTAPTDEEREKARREYLDKRGVPDSSLVDTCGHKLLKAV